MKSLKMMFGIGVFALGVASAASGYSVKLYEPLMVGTTELKPGDYKVEMEGDKAVFKMGKTTIEVPATMATSEKKFASNSVSADGKQLIEIDFAGTTAKMLFGAPVQAAK
jgi:hypothetical protein